MNTFYLGTHRPNWLGQVDIPLMVSRRVLAGRRTFSRATAPWALDSGGFTELSLFGGWRTSEAQFVSEIRRIVQGIGMVAFAAPQDWMCEPWVLAKTGKTVEEHQRLTVANWLSLSTIAPEIPWLPVLQGWALPDYQRHVQMYGEAGVNLSDRLVGLGTVCRRQATTEIEDIVLSLRSLRLHGFGVKTEGFSRYAYLLESADSMAWSYGGRMRTPDLHLGCTKKACANCLPYALAWRERALRRLEHQQLHLVGA